jgi:hypothetical protein
MLVVVMLECFARLLKPVVFIVEDRNCLWLECVDPVQELVEILLYWVISTLTANLKGRAAYLSHYFPCAGIGIGVVVGMFLEGVKNVGALDEVDEYEVRIGHGVRLCVS